MEQFKRTDWHDDVAQKNKNSNGKWVHAMATTLRGKKGLIEYYELYTFSPSLQQQQQPQNSPSARDSDCDVDICIAAAIIKVGNLLDGPRGTVHGGIVAFLFDDVMGFACQSVLPLAVTRDLFVTLKRPQPHNEYVIIRVYIDNINNNNDVITDNNKNNTKSSNNNNNNNNSDSTQQRKKRVHLRATCKSLSSNSTVKTAPFDKNDDGILYSTAKITMVQVNRPPSARGDSQIPIKSTIASNHSSFDNKTIVPSSRL